MLVTTVALAGLFTLPASAEPVKLDAVLAQKALTRLDFADGSKHYVALLQREGKAATQGLLAGAMVALYAFHDVVPGAGADHHEYLVFTTPEGDMAYVKCSGRAVFVTGSDGKTRVLNNNVWEVVGATGKLKGLQGAGTFRVSRVSDAERMYSLEGDLVMGR